MPASIFDSLAMLRNASKESRRKRREGKSKFDGPKSDANAPAEKAKPKMKRRNPSDEVKGDGDSSLDTLAYNLAMQSVNRPMKSRAGKILQGALQGYLLGMAGSRK